MLASVRSPHIGRLSPFRGDVSHGWIRYATFVALIV